MQKYVVTYSKTYNKKQKIKKDCGKKYTGQIGRNFKIGYSEHLPAFRNGSINSSFAQHLLEHGHAFGKVEDIMEILCFNKTSVRLNTPEKCRIHNETKSDNQLNEKNTVFHNKIFEAI